MTEPIRAKVAKILNSREVVITAGSEQGVRVGMRFDILDRKGENITDPDTGKVLGSVERPKVRVEIVQVQERISVASTYKRKMVNEGGNALEFGFGDYARALTPSKWVEVYETLKTDETTWEDIKEYESYVKTGDPVAQVIERVPVRDSDKLDEG